MAWPWTRRGKDPGPPAARPAGGSDRTARVLIGVPLYQGWDLVHETLDSILSQTFTDYRVVISVDGADQRSYDACLRYAEDPRFELVLQPEHLGWADNVTWLARQLREDYFVYWQHDDLCDPPYLETLLDHAHRHPEASAVYCDMMMFGDREVRRSYDPVIGYTLERVIEQIARNGPMPIRCLVRADAMRAALPIDQVGPWTVAMARVGELHRIEQPLYHRRSRPDSLSIQMRSGGMAQAREGALEWGVGVFRAALPAAPEADQTRLLRYVCDQLINHRPRRNFHYDAKAAGPTGPLDFMRDFLGEVRRQTGVIPFAHLARRSDARALLEERLKDFEEPAVEILMIQVLLEGLD